MNFEEILNQWEAQTQQPYGKKRIRKDLKNPTAVAYALENTHHSRERESFPKRPGTVTVCTKIFRNKCPCG